MDFFSCFPATKSAVILRATLGFNFLIDHDEQNHIKGLSITERHEAVAYEGVLKEGFGVDIFSEFFFQPFALNGAPGFYFKPMYSHSTAWINKNKLPLDIGLLWNVTNDDKDAKNLLTIVPYIS